MHDTHPSDMRPAYMGLIFGMVAILVMVVTIVKLTNAHYAAEKPAATAPR